MSDSLYEKAKDLLWREYYENFEIVKGSDFHKAFINEKIKHSLQVAGAGNGIIKNENYFKNKTPEFIEITKTAILLHDIYRFREVRGWFETGEKIDHGVKGSEFLAQFEVFNNPLITIAVKHHGHMIEELYQDTTFQAFDPQIQDDIKHISFAVRDADKIANWYLVTHEFENMREVWLPHPFDTTKRQSDIDSTLLQYFFNCQVSPNKLRKTNADTAVSIMCWLFDMNYLYSILYCKRLKLFEAFCRILGLFQVDSQLIEQIRLTMQDYVFKKFHQEI